MKVLDEGHKYALGYVGEFENIEGILEVDFMKRIDGKMVSYGTTNEDVLEMLIDRMNYLQKKLPCRENAIVITKLEECLMWLNYRTQKRVDQNVETKDIEHK